MHLIGTAKTCVSRFIHAPCIYFSLDIPLHEKKRNSMNIYVYGLLLCQGGERTSQSRDQNIEIEYKYGNFVSLPIATGKIDVSILWMVFLHIKLFDILLVMQIFQCKEKITRESFTHFFKKMNENDGTLSLCISQKGC